VLRFFGVGASLALILALLPLPGMAAERDPEIASLAASLEREGIAAGISVATIETAMSGLTRDPEVAVRAAAQPEHELTAGTYLTRIITAERIEGGRQALVHNDAMLRAIEARYGVDRHILLAVWGIETTYGTAVGHRSVVRSLATLTVVDQRRAVFWRRELLAALAILDLAMPGRRISLARGRARWGKRSSCRQPSARMPSISMVTADAICGEHRPTLWPPLPRTSRPRAGALETLGAWKSRCRRGSTRH
jgi:hypothetical protein